MNLNLAEEALEVGAVLEDTIAAAGGLALLRAAVDDPDARGAAQRLLDDFGVWGLQPLEDRVELEVAAAVCRAAGTYALPYPVVERLAAGGGAARALVATEGDRVADHADLDLAWSGIDLRGAVYDLSAPRRIEGAVLAPFACRVEASPTGETAPASAALAATLQAWWLSGLLQRAVDETVRYAREREQFGRPLIRFQGVSFTLADMTVEVEALRELSKYTLWTLAEAPSVALTEALGLRLAALRAAHVVLRGAQQLHGAMGFTHEVDVSWLSRASQTARRVCGGQHATSVLLEESVRAAGWHPFGQPARPSAVG